MKSQKSLFLWLLLSLTSLFVWANQFWMQEDLAEKKIQTIDHIPTNIILDSRDGQQYAYIQLGELFWMKENLAFKAPQSECYDGEEKNCEKYGRLYSYTDSRTACPDGWHLPSPQEWKSLKKLMKSGKADKIVSEGEWEAEEFSGANNELGLSVLPGGRKDEKGPANRENEFGEIGISTSYWLDHGEYHWHIRWGKSHIHKHGDISKQGRKFYIRCVQLVE